MSRVACLLALVTLGACHTSVYAPSAVESVTYPCDDPTLLASRTSACLANASCAGVVGMKGRLGGNEVVVDLQLDTSTFDFVTPSGSVPQLDDATSTGAATYFFFDFSLESLGGAQDTTDTMPAVYQTERGAALAPSQYADSLVDLEITVIADGESELFEAVDGTGWTLIQSRSPGQIAGTFHGDFGPAAEELSGCFLQRATQTRFVSTQ